MDRSPSRRAFAALAASAVAGCVSLPNGDSSNDGPANESDTENGSSGIRDRVQTNCTTSLASPDPFPDLQIESDDVPADAEVATCVEPVEPFTDDAPAKLAVELANVSDSSAEYSFGVSPPWGGLWSESMVDGSMLCLVPDDREYVARPEEVIPARPTDGCWRAESVIEVEAIGLTQTVDPGETIREEYTILATEDSPCLTLGSYRFEEAYDPVSTAWGFDITLSA
ncbi:hypothetical protein GCM10028857_29640 [Salinarchaeum chitinilyticum]